MKHIVQIKPSGNLLLVEEGQTVLQAALQQGYEFPYSCGSATCGTCMGKVLSGSFTYGNIQPYALDADAQENGFALFCSVHPTSDMVIEVEDVYAANFIPARKAEYQVTDYTLLTDEIYQVLLQPKKKPLDYNAGQYVQILCDDGIPLPFSIANMPQKNELIELQIKNMPDNPYTVEIINQIKAKQTFTLRGPYGTVRYYPELNLPIIFMAGGTGIVPIKALIEQALAHDTNQPLHLYWGAKTKHDLYLFDVMQALAAQHPRFTFTPTISGTDEYWQGQAGLVHEVIAQEHNDLSGFQVYASGPADMVYSAYDVFTAQGLKPQLMFSDTFEVFAR